MLVLCNIGVPVYWLQAQKNRFDFTAYEGIPFKQYICCHNRLYTLDQREHNMIKLLHVNNYWNLKWSAFDVLKRLMKYPFYAEIHYQDYICFRYA